MPLMLVSSCTQKISNTFGLTVTDRSLFGGGKVSLKVISE